VRGQLAAIYNDKLFVGDTSARYFFSGSSKSFPKIKNNMKILFI
jgi:hypothetical protein